MKDELADDLYHEHDPDDDPLGIYPSDEFLFNDFEDIDSSYSINERSSLGLIYLV